jgi:hypothetical protein
MLTPHQVLDRYFPEVRAALISTAAVLDRLDRARSSAEPTSTPSGGGGHSVGGDPRLALFHESLRVLADTAPSADRALRIQRLFSDLSTEPAPSAPRK